MKTLAEIQKEIGEWAKEQFGSNLSRDDSSPLWNHPLGSLAPLLGMVEEIGELCHAVVYRHQGRGYDNVQEHREAKEDAVADLMVFACDYANREGMDLTAILNKVWDKVSKRRRDKWAADKAKEVAGEEQTTEKTVRCFEYEGGREVELVGTGPIHIPGLAALVDSEVELKDKKCEVCGIEANHAVHDRGRYDHNKEETHYYCAKHTRRAQAL